MDNRKTIKKIIADIPADVHSHVKASAALQGLSMQSYIIKALIEKLTRESKNRSLDDSNERILSYEAYKEL